MAPRVVFVPAALANGALPTAYDPNWRTYQGGLTPAQVAAFQAFPQDLARFALQCHALNLQNVAGSNGVTAAGASAYIASVTAAAQSVLAGIVAATPTITTPAQVSSTILKVAPTAVP